MRYSIDGGGRFSVRHTHALIGLNEGPGLLSLPDEITPVIDIGDDERQRNMLRNGLEAPCSLLRVQAQEASPVKGISVCDCVTHTGAPERACA